ncbi:hypothetical protein [Phenylobacterium sp.]
MSEFFDVVLHFIGYALGAGVAVGAFFGAAFRVARWIAGDME